MRKKQNFIGFFLISMIWKSDYWSLHNVLNGKSGQNAEKSGIWVFSVLTIWKCPYNYEMNGLKPNIIPHMNAMPVNYGMQLCQICRILMTMSNGIVSKKGYRKITILMTFDLFKWRPHQTLLSKSQICEINAFHNSLVLIWGIM